MRLLILSDVHSNLTALDAVLSDAERGFAPDAVALLGDYVDYGMRPNEVVRRLATLAIPVVCSLWGNHERAIMLEDWGRFSSPRGSASARYTHDVLNGKSRSWLDVLDGRNGFQEFELVGKRFLAIHGCLSDPFWQALDFQEAQRRRDYADYDYVLSGHNHIPHCFSIFYECDDFRMRNRKKTVFVNPGSVGQPRDHDPRSRYAIWDSESGMVLRAVSYNVAAEQELYDGSIDDFYRSRLSLGI